MHPAPKICAKNPPVSQRVPFAIIVLTSCALTITADKNTLEKGKGAPRHRPKQSSHLPCTFAVCCFRARTMNLTHVMTFVAGFQCFPQSNCPLRLAWNCFAGSHPASGLGLFWPKLLLTLVKIRRRWQKHLFFLFLPHLISSHLPQWASPIWAPTTSAGRPLH